MNDVVQRAEKIVLDLSRNEKGFNLTSSQLRKFLAAVNSLQNRVMAVEGNDLEPDIANEIRYLKIKLAYQAREKSVKDFVVKSGIMEDIDRIGSSKKAFLEFARLIEGIIAYHRYHGGKER